MTSNNLQIHHIRHATMFLSIGGKILLTDPMLSPKGAMEPSSLSTNQVRIPLTPLPVEESAFQNIDAILLTHTHFDHYDERAKEILNREVPVFCQPSDVNVLHADGFTDVIPVEHMCEWEGITIHRVEGNHGAGEVGVLMGNSSGYMIGYGDGRTVYVGGDAIYDSQFEQNLRLFNPETVILFAGEAQLKIGGPITMSSRDVVDVCRQVPDAKVVVVHMEALNHCGLTRMQLRKDLLSEQLMAQVIIPADGEKLSL